MINISLITQALEERFRSHEDFQDWKIIRGGPINEDPGVAKNGWLGIYRRNVIYEPLAARSAAQRWNGDVQVTLVVQATDYRSGAECEDILESRVKSVMDLVDTDLQNNSTVDTIREVTIDYSYLETERDSIFFQAALINIQMEAR